jgi:hypothetical protein
MASHMVFLTKLGFENLKILVTPSPFCKVVRVTELLDGRVTSSPWKTKSFQGLDDDFGLKRPNHHLGPEYVHLFGAKKVWYMGRLFWEISSFMQKPWRSYTIWRYWSCVGPSVWENLKAWCSGSPRRICPAPRTASRLLPTVYTVLIVCRSQRVGEFEGLVQRISPDNLSSTSHCLKTDAYYIHGIDHV